MCQIVPPPAHITRNHPRKSRSNAFGIRVVSFQLEKSGN
jgi:hypothetical protein